MVDGSVRGGDFSWPQAGTSAGHHWGPHLATSGDFLMATDTKKPALTSRTESRRLRSSLDFYDRWTDTVGEGTDRSS